MVILHIARLDDAKASGVNVVVPEHVRFQRQLADAALWRVSEGSPVPGLERQFFAKSLDELPEPYNRPDIAVFHEVYVPAFLPVSRQLRKLGIPYVIVPHSSLNRAAQQKSRLKKAAGNLLLFKPFCEHAAGIQCLTEHERRECVFGKNRFVAPNGVAPASAAKTGFSKNGVRFVYIGRLQPVIKGLDIMIEAFSRKSGLLRANGCTLDIYGPDDDRGERCAEAVRSLIAENNAGGFVKLHGAVYGEKKTNALLNSDVFVQTSRNDGMPMGVLEALSHGLPCLVTEGSAMADSVDSFNAGWSARTDSTSVAEALERAVGEKSLLSEKSNGALLCAAAYSWKNAAKTAVEKYSLLVNS